MNMLMQSAPRTSAADCTLGGEVRGGGLHGAVEGWFGRHGWAVNSRGSSVSFANVI